jgi:plastocyanin
VTVAQTPDRDPGRGTRGGRRGPGFAGAAGLMVLALALGAVAAVMVAGGGDDAAEPAPEPYSVVVPAGTSARVAAGEPVELIPSDLQLPVGTELVIENRDVETQEVGPFVVRAGETLRHTFATRGVYAGACTVHPDGQITITVF